MYLLWGANPCLANFLHFPLDGVDQRIASVILGGEIRPEKLIYMACSFPFRTAWEVKKWTLLSATRVARTQMFLVASLVT